MKKVLIVENEQKLVTLMTTYLEEAGYFVMSTGEGSQAINKVNESHVDVAIVDIMLDDLDGWRVCRHIKKHTQTKVLILTARHDEEDKLLGYELGADDYMTKPFSLKELVIRVDKVFHMQHPHESPIALVQNNLEVFVYGKKITLTKTEYDLISFFMHHPNEALTRERLLNDVWGYMYEGDTRTVDTTIKRLRKKLMPLSCIHTVFGVGYKYEVLT